MACYLRVLNGLLKSLSIVMSLFQGVFNVEDILLVARHTDIRWVDLSTPGDRGSVIPLTGLGRVVAVDYDPLDQLVYWSDVESRTISRVHINGTAQSVVVSSNISVVDGLAIDTTNRILYWTDADYDVIESMSLDGTERKAVISTGLDQPRAIVLLPQHNMIYWTDWGESEPKIERSLLDGTSREAVVSASLRWPNCLVLDPVDGAMYWADSYHGIIERAELDGTNRVQLISRAGRAFSMTMYGSELFWSDWQAGTVERFDTVTSTRNEPVMSYMSLMKGLTAVNVHGYGDSLFVIGQREIRQFTLDAESDLGLILPLTTLGDALTLDYNPNDQRIYWADDASKTLNRAFLNGTDQEAIVRTDIGDPVGMAVDPESNQIFWVDRQRLRIVACNTDGSGRRDVITGLENPRSISLDSAQRVLYWTSWTGRTAGAKIERALYDGSRREELINSSMSRPVGPVLDLSRSTMYWADTLIHTLEMADLDGANRKLLISGDDRFQNVYGISMLGDYIYWTQFTSKLLYKVSTLDFTDIAVAVDAQSLFMGIKAAKTLVTEITSVNVRTTTGVNRATVHPQSDTGHSSPMLTEEFTQQAVTTGVNTAIVEGNQTFSVSGPSSFTSQDELSQTTMIIAYQTDTALNVNMSQSATTPRPSLSQSGISSTDLQSTIDIRSTTTPKQSVSHSFTNSTESVYQSATPAGGGVSKTIATISENGSHTFSSQPATSSGESVPKFVTSPSNIISQSVATPTESAAQSVATSAESLSPAITSARTSESQSATATSENLSQIFTTLRQSVSQSVTSPTESTSQSVTSPRESVSQYITSPTESVSQSVTSPTESVSQYVSTLTEVRSAATITESVPHSVAPSIESVSQAVTSSRKSISQTAAAPTESVSQSVTTTITDVSQSVAIPTESVSEYPGSSTESVSESTIATPTKGVLESGTSTENASQFVTTPTKRASQSITNPTESVSQAITPTSTIVSQSITTTSERVSQTFTIPGERVSQPVSSSSDSASQSVPTTAKRVSESFATHTGIESVASTRTSVSQSDAIPTESVSETLTSPTESVSGSTIVKPTKSISEPVTSTESGSHFGTTPTERESQSIKTPTGKVSQAVTSTRETVSQILTTPGESVSQSVTSLVESVSEPVTTLDEHGTQYIKTHTESVSKDVTTPAHSVPESIFSTSVEGVSYTTPAYTETVVFSSHTAETVSMDSRTSDESASQQFTVTHQESAGQSTTTLHTTSSTTTNHGTPISVTNQASVTVDASIPPTTYEIDRGNLVPVIDDVVPQFGPIAGGTLISVHGDNLPVPVSGVTLQDGTQLLLVNSTSTMILALTPAVDTRYVNQAMTLTVRGPGGGTLKTTFTFTYKANPSINGIHPLKTIKEGGTSLTVSGEELGSIAAPKLNTTVVNNNIQSVQLQNLPRVQTYITPCFVHNNTAMHCITPRITLPTNIATGSMCRDEGRGTDPSCLDNEQSEFTIYIGIVLDGVPNYRNLSANDDLKDFGIISMTSTPTFARGLKLKYDGTPIHIPATHMMTCCELNDISVDIGQGTCLDLTLTDDVITCMPPREPPEKRRGKETAEGHIIQVRVGVNIQYDVGTIVYKTRGMAVWIIAVCSLAGLVLAVLWIVLLVWRVRKDRKQLIICGKSSEDAHQQFRPIQPDFMIDLPSVNMDFEDRIETNSNPVNGTENQFQWIRTNTKERVRGNPVLHIRESILSLNDSITSLDNFRDIRI